VDKVVINQYKEFYMKNSKIILCAALMVMAVFSVYSQQNDEKDFKTKFVDGGKGVEITGYEGINRKIKIPERINNVPVVSIGRAFEGTNIISIIIPNGVTGIGNNAFNGCASLTKVTIPNSVTGIGNNAFKNCANLTKVSLPNSVTDIGYSAFENCVKLTGVNIPNGVTGIKTSVFEGCASLTSVTIPNSVNTNIGVSAFKNCVSLAKITIPNGVPGIMISAFSNCAALTNITIPKSVTKIDDFVFSGCAALTAINVAAGNDAYSSVNGVLYHKDNDKTILQKYPEGKKDASFTIPNYVTNIRDFAFRRCNKLVRINITDSVTGMGGEAIYDCAALTAVDVTPGNSAYSSENGILYNKDKTTLRKYPAGMKDTSFTIPDSVTFIYTGAFYACVSLKSIIIPDSVTGIGDYAFYDCANLSDVTLSKNIADIMEFAFYRCTALSVITIPKSVIGIGEYAFYRCTSLGAVTFEGTMRKANIGYYYDEYDDDYDEGDSPFYGDLKERYLARGRGTYTTTAPVNDNSKWTR